MPCWPSCWGWSSRVPGAGVMLRAGHRAGEKGQEEEELARGAELPAAPFPMPHGLVPAGTCPPYTKGLPFGGHKL